MEIDEVLVPQDGEIKQIIEEIEDQDEVSRRALVARAHQIYRDGGKDFLIEQIKTEFNEDALKEMRLAPINVLKKIINKRSTTYNRTVIRMSEEAQSHVDYYTEDLSMNEHMAKAHRYFNLHANTALYSFPELMSIDGDQLAKIQFQIVPPHLYSIVPKEINRTRVDTWIFSDFAQKGRVVSEDNTKSATGAQGFERTKGFKPQEDKVASEERQSEQTARRYIFWNEHYHLTANGDGQRMFLNENLGEEQFINPIGCMPIVNLAKERDNEPWATQGRDQSDLALLLQLMMSDVATIAKHQGFGVLVSTSEEQPRSQTIGLNRIVWNKINPESKIQPTMDFLQANSPLTEYKDLSMSILALLLSTNDMNPGAIAGDLGSKNFTSGFHALIEMSDALEATKRDESALRNAEKQNWRNIAKWHNFLFEQNLLTPEARSLGAWPEEFNVSIQYVEPKPIESEKERIEVVKELRGQGLMTKHDALKKLHPDLTEDQIEEKLAMIKAENQQEVEAIVSKLDEVPEEKVEVDPRENAKIKARERFNAGRLNGKKKG